MRALPDAWRGIEIERRSWAVVRRLTADGRWRRLQWYRARLWFVSALASVLVLVACALASLTMVLADRMAVEQRLAVAAALEAEWRGKIAALERRRCLEWPKWCAEEKRKARLRREKGGLSDGAATGAANEAGDGQVGTAVVPPVRPGAFGADRRRDLLSL